MTRKGKVQLQSEITTNLADNSNRDISAEDVRNVATNITDSMIFPGSGVVADFAVGAIVIESEGIGSNDNDTTIPTSAAVKDYVDGSTSAGTIATGTWEATDVAVAHGGTGASTASSARTNLGVAIGSNVQAYDAQLGTLAALTANQVGGLVDLATLEAPASDGQFIVATGAGVFAYENGSTARTSLGLGNVENTALSTWVGTTNITTLGTIATGTWQGTAIARTYIAADAINGDKIDDDSIDSEHYAAGSIDEEHLNASNSPTDNYILSYDSASGGFTWVAAGAGEANEYSFKTISVSGQDNVVADTTTDTLTFAAGSNVTITTTAASDTVTIAAADTNTMGSGFTVSATTDTTATTITQGDDLMFTAGTGITCETTADGTVTISCTVTDTNTTYTKASFDLDHLFTLVDATADTSEHLGTFTGSTISDSVTIKAALQALETAVETKGATAGSSSIVTTGALDSGSITSGFGAIDNGSSNITTTGTLDISGGTLTLAVNQISGDKVEGGTIAATTITALTTAGITATSNIDIGGYDLRAATVTADGLTSGRVVFAGTAGVLSDDADLTFSGDTLTATKIKVSDGGTIGSASDADAITIATEGDVTFSKAIKPAAPAAASGTSGIVVLDCDTTNHFTITASGNITGWNFTNASVGQRIIVRVTNGASHTVGFSATGDGDVVYFPGGTEPVLTTSGGIDVYGFLCVAADTFDGFIIGQDIKA